MIHDWDGDGDRVMAEDRTGASAVVFSVVLNWGILGSPCLSIA